jgi:acyl carrier protein
MNQAIERRIVILLTEHLDRAPGEVHAGSRLFEDLGADSLDIMRFLQVLEDEFATLLDERDALKLRTVGDFIVYVSSRPRGPKGY